MHVIAVDLGASNGRVMKVEFGDGFQLEEIHRFQNTPVEKSGRLSWNIQQLWRETIKGVEWAIDGAQSIGIDSWGVDFGLLDQQGTLIEDPVHYRDSRTDDMMDWVFKRMGRREIFNKTGIQFLPLNTLYQLASLSRRRKKYLNEAKTYLGFPDLFNYWLTGEKRCEFTHATTTQMYNPVKKTWDEEIIESIGLHVDMFSSIVQPGTILGAMKEVNVTAPACHDTGSAVAAVPTKEKDFCYISSGTWSLLGTEIKNPVINDKVYELNFTNEGGVEGTTRLIRNLPGLWFEQELLREWIGKGANVDHEDLQTMASVTKPFKSLIDPWDASFLAPGEMTPRIAQFCRSTGQHEPISMGEYIRCVYDSLAALYRHALHQLESITGKHYDVIHVIGGGSRNRMVNQLTADATGRTVIAGPVEATALGNAIMQFKGIGLLMDVWEARKVLDETLELDIYQPKSGVDWDTAYTRFTDLIHQ
jgi:rhamnulokinase